MPHHSKPEDMVKDWVTLLFLVFLCALALPPKKKALIVFLQYQLLTGREEFHCLFLRFQIS